MSKINEDENEDVTQELGEDPGKGENLSQDEGTSNDKSSSQGEEPNQDGNDPGDADEDKPDGGDTPDPPKIEPTEQENAALAHVVNQTQLLKQIVTDPNADYPVADPVHAYQKYSDVVKASIKFALDALRPELRKEIVDETEESAQKITFFDDLFYRFAMTGKIIIIQLFLRILLGEPKLTLTDMVLQKHFDFPHPYHSIVSDTYCESDDKRIFSIDLQNGKKDETAPRAIFYGHVIGFTSLRSGKNYKKLKPTYIIFLTDEDIPGTGEFIHWETMNTFDPRIHTIFVNCSYAFDRLKENIELDNLLSKVEQEMDQNAKEAMEKRIEDLKSRKQDQDKKMRAEMDKYGISEGTWKEVLVFGHDLRCSDWKDMQRSDLAEIMRVAKEPIAEGVSAMNAVLWKKLEDTREETRREKDREFAKMLLKDGIDMQIINKYTGLSLNEIQDLAISLDN